MRDLTCRWPGCDAPVCDADHTVPYPAGPTSRANMKLYCRTHHLVKTFYCGAGGWAESQSPDGTVKFTSPTGHTYTTESAGGQLFPALSASADMPTAEPATLADTGPPAANRGLAMPTRSRTRDEERRSRIERERRIRAELNAGCVRARARRLAANAADPPPF